MMGGDPEFQQYMKERTEKERTTDYHSLKSRF